MRDQSLRNYLIEQCLLAPIANRPTLRIDNRGIASAAIDIVTHRIPDWASPEPEGNPEASFVVSGSACDHRVRAHVLAMGGSNADY
jgi:hypothetical protein